MDLARNPLTFSDNLERRMPAATALSPLDRLARHAVMRRLAALRFGQLLLRDVDGTTRRFGEACDSGLAAQLSVQHPAFYRAVLWGGSLGAAESFARGEWVSDDVVALVRLFVRNQAVLTALEPGRFAPRTLARNALHALRRNTRAGSRRNISAHYDLSNDFFRLFLDETMMYSSAIFSGNACTLQAAQLVKLDAICDALRLTANDHVLEIGCGWGGFALHAARTRGCRMTAVTISREQYALACERVAQAGLEHLVDVRLCDYRDVRGAFDAIVSIEMIEALGHQYFEMFFSTCAGLLKPGGRMVLQGITIADQAYAAARDEVDFIKKYIFPGCCIPSVEALLRAATSGSDLRLTSLTDIAPHYATTLGHWRERFLQRRADADALGFGNEFCRMWEFYLAYCEAGFTERYLGCVHLHFNRPMYPTRGAPLQTPRADALGTRRN